VPTGFWLAYCAYLAWLAAGLADFLCHWRTDLPHTSGVAESASHLVQLALLGAGVVLFLAFEPGRLAVVLLLVLVVAHAVVGYVDTWIAFTRHRPVRPVEQHVHSVLDMAPIVGFAWIVVSGWPSLASEGWVLEWRRPPFAAGLWAAVLGPPFVLCIGPALLEFRAAWKAKRGGDR